MKRRLGILISAGILMLAAAPNAHAVFSMAPQIDFATSPIAVGSSGTGTFTFTNDSTAGETAMFIERIVLEPSCRLPGDPPPCENREPGIFSITNAVGVVGTSCQGLTFNVTLGAAPFGGSLEFGPPNAIPAMPPNAECVINFTYTALAVPTFDTQPGEPGMDTDQNAVVRADSGGGPVTFGPATDFTAVSPAPPPTNPPVTNPTPTPTTPAPPRCKKGQKLKKGKCVKKKRKKK
jgi:hypothetical protein